MKKYYIEKDGRIFLIQKNGIFTLPTDKIKLSFEITLKSKLPSTEIFFCDPNIDFFPENWFFKDEALLMKNVDDEVKRCIIKSYIRPAVLGIVKKDGKVLMVKSNKGVTKNFWNLPGGFLNFDEKPEDALKREIKEETGLNVKITDKPMVYTHIFNQFPMLGIVYECEIIGGKLKSGFEIIESQYKTVRFGIKNTKNNFVKMALSEINSIEQKKIKAIVFDLDNTLMDFMRMKMEASEAAVSAMIDAGLDINYKDGIEILKETFEKYGIENQNIFNIFLEKVIGRVDYRILSAGVVAYRKVKESFVEPYPTVIPTLIKLMKRGYTLGIVSDAPMIQAWTRLCGLKLQHFFDFVITFDDTGVKKPNKKVFDLVKKRLNLKAEEIAIVGDNLSRDIYGGKLAGFKTIFAKYGYIKETIEKNEHKKIKPDHIIKNFKEILNVV